MISPMRILAGLVWLGFALGAGLRTVAAPAEAEAGTAIEAGRVLYAQQCARCHGARGEGVPGKYRHALEGDWSVERLTRYIDRNMPEDAPEACVGEAAAQVARYLHGAFYAPAARARTQPPRVELVRLTNRQYVTAVADLLRAFSRAEPPPGPERGLQASYRGARQARDREPLLERVEPVVEADFLRPDAEPSVGATNELAATWRGSVFAEESGDHVFLLETPNGARLWVNDDHTPVIDASVASATATEHRATRRLLGGRWYPLRLEWFKAPKDPAATVALKWVPPHGVPAPIPTRCLSPARSTPTYVVTTPFPADDRSVGYERGVAVSKAWDDATTQAALEVAQHVAERLERFTGVGASAPDRGERAQAFGVRFLELAFRRPLSAEQRAAWVAGAFTAAPKLEDAVRRVVLLGLKSPRFLYLGLDAGEPDDYDVATRLAFGLWDSLPDAELRAAAARGDLRTRAAVEGQARRMLGDARTRAKLRQALHHWLEVDQVESLAKDDQLFPGFTPEIVADLRTSLNLFLEDVVWHGGADYRRLLTDGELFVNGRLARFYGMATNLGGDFVRASPAPEPRSGVLTHPYLLARFAYPRSTSPIHRGVFLTRQIVGRTLKPPPQAVAFKDAEFAPTLSMREKVAELTRPASCQACHAVINPLGFSLEHYDAVGRFRTHEAAQPIDAVSELPTDEGGAVRLTGARDVAAFAVSHPQAQQAFVELLFHQVAKQPLLAYGPDLQERLRAGFVNSEFNLQQLLVDVAVVSALHGVAPPPNA